MLTVLFQSPSKDDISTLSALEIAEQMTYLDQKIMFTINSNEFLEQAWIKSERKEKSPHIVVMTKRFNDVSNVFWEGHKNWKIFTVNFTICSNRQIDGEDFVNFVAFLENMNFTTVVLLLLGRHTFFPICSFFLGGLSYVFQYASSSICYVSIKEKMLPTTTYSKKGMMAG